jgi:hypothetical protein
MVCDWSRCRVTITALILALAVYGAVALGQKTYRTYIIPPIDTQDKSLKDFEKAVREALNDISKRLEDGGR